MDLLERYVLEVRRFLPAKDADDVAEELRVLLSDSLEARSAEAGRPIDEKMVADALRSFGDPETVADRYREPRYLIGPRLYPSFEYLAWIIAVAPALVGLFGHIVAVVMNDRPLLPTFGQLATVAITYAGRTLATLGVAAIVFAIFDRRLPSTWTRQDIEGGGRQWDPHSLPQLPHTPLHEPVSLDDVGPSFWGLAILLVVLNVAPALLGIPWGFNYDYRWVPVTDLGVPLPVIALNLYWGGRLLLNVMLAQAGRWTTTLRWSELVLGLCGGTVAAWMLWSSSSPSQGDWAVQFDKMHRLVRLVLWGAVAIAAWLTLRRLGALLTVGKVPVKSPYGTTS